MDDTDDAEITAMMTIKKVMSRLTDEEADHVLLWAMQRFGSARLASVPYAGRALGAEQDVSTNDEGSGVADGHRDFSRFADLFHSANPSSLPEKAAVAGYWLQVIQGNDNWRSREAQKELRELGEQMDNIAAALRKLMTRTPKEVIQAGKAGDREKMYKLTTRGVQLVEDMLA